MAIESLAPTGKLVRGSVADCNKAALERALKFYDSQLYLKWNPKKNGGYGVWEIRRKPDTATKVYQTTFNGQKFYTLEYVEHDLIHHVLDLPRLSYDVLGKLKSIDAWAQKDFISNLDYTAARHKEQEEKSAREELRYNIKQFKREWKDFAALVSQGVNPGQILKGFKG